MGYLVQNLHQLLNNNNFKMINISIIIPIYNASETLSRAIDSVISQKEQNFELILVDDGSTDNSLQICNEYALKDSRIKVIHQVNAGVSVARNNGIINSQGYFLGFVDSDDWIEPKMYYDLLNIAKHKNVDIIICDATTIYSNGKREIDTITQLNNDCLLNKIDISSNLLIEIAGSSWRCIYRNNKDILFPLNIKFSEDRIFNLYQIGNSKKIYYTKKAYYNRWISSNSTVHRFHHDYFESIKKSHIATLKAIEQAWDNNKKIKNEFLIHFINGSFMAICNYFYFSSSMTLIQKIDKLKIICNDQDLINAINQYGIDFKRSLILKKKYFLLIAYAILSNIKNAFF